MSIPKIDPYPPAPTPEDSEEVFDDKAYAHAASLELRRVQMNEVASYVNTRAADANNRATASASSATASANSATRADEWANKAPGSVVASGKYSARHYTDLSDKFANAAEDVEVAPGKYSAQHYMEKAKKIADVHATTVATDPLPTVLATNVQEALQDLAYQADQLRIAKNQLKYGDGPYPMLDFQFAGAKLLDPRITFTRASVDWDGNGREYGTNEPVLTEDGLWASGARTNLFLQSIDLLKTPWRSLGSVRRIEGLKSPVGADVFSLDRSEQGVNYFYQPISILPGRSYVVSCFVKFETGEEEYRLLMGSSGFQDYGTAVFKQGSDGEMIVTGSGRYKSLGAGWYLIWRSAVGVDVVSGNPIQIHAYPVETEIDNYISAPQLEVGLIPTPYIPTGGSQVTVANTDASLDVAGIFGDEGTVVFEVYMAGPRVEPGFALTMVGDGGSSEYMGLGYGVTTPNSVYIFSGGISFSRNLASSVSPTFNTRCFLAFTWTGRDFAFFVNGVKAYSGTHGAALPTFKTLQIARRGNAFWSPLFARGLQLYTKRLTDEQLQGLTAL